MMIGGTLGQYEILGKLGEGGMGVVYKAHDTRLDRAVALKVLPPEKVADPERKRRFVQEAKTASSLNHPNIITIYDINSDAGVDYIAMEYVDGKPLDQAIPRYGMRLGEALRCAIQIADALAKAHAAGVIHRDLKPGNLMVTQDGLVKVLDFGLAKLTEPAAAADSELTQTIAANAPKTEEGAIVGTASYMSPEQAEGLKLDVRSDIFSFGAVLYEMLTGQRAFQASSRLSTLSAILKEDPKSVTDLAPSIPLELEKLIARCLRKDPARRIQTMSDLKVALEDLKEESETGKLAAKPMPAKRSLVSIISSAAALVGLIIAAERYFLREKPATEQALRAVPLTTYPGIEMFPTFSPDGNQVAFVWDGEKQDNLDIYVKLIGPGAPLRLTTDPAPDVGPAWSPDGRTIAFLRRTSERSGEVILIPALGGPERKLTPVDLAPFQPPSLQWSPDGKSLIVTRRHRPQGPIGLAALSVETGEMRRLTEPVVPTDSDGSPAISPDGRKLVFQRGQNMTLSGLHLVQLRPDLSANGEPRLLPNQGRFPAWTPDGREILFTVGLPERALLYRMRPLSSDPPRQIGVGEGVGMPVLSRQGNRLCFSRRFRDSNIWRAELAEGGKAGNARSFIASTFRETYPQFSPDGKRIAFYSNRTNNYEIWTCDANGANAVQVTSLGASVSGSPHWSPDGRRIAFDSNLGGQWNIYVVNADGGKPKPLTHAAATNIVPAWSRDGRWIYFGSDRGGPFQVWKAPAEGGQPVQVTQNGGISAAESLDGQSLYYTKGESAATLWKASVAGGQETQILPSIFRYTFTLVPNGIYFVPAPNPDGSSTIQFYSFATQKITPVMKIEKPADLGVTVSPDGRTLLYSQVDYTGADLMLVENFR